MASKALNAIGNVRRLEFPKPNLAHHVAVMVPSTKNVSHPVGRKQWAMRTRHVQNTMTSLFGGGTNYGGGGTYATEEKLGDIYRGVMKRLRGKKANFRIAEPVAKVEAFTDMKTLKRYDRAFFKWVGRLAQSWGQRSMGVSIDGRMFFVSAPKKAKKAASRVVRALKRAHGRVKRR
jgi:hypothetical protein